LKKIKLNTKKKKKKNKNIIIKKIYFFYKKKKKKKIRIKESPYKKKNVRRINLKRKRKCSRINRQNKIFFLESFQASFF
jgi:hypothetical protein